MKFSEIPYSRTDKESAINEITKLTENAVNAANGKELFENHKNYYKLNDKIATEVTIAQIRFSMNTADDFYKNEVTYYDNLLPEFEVYNDAYKKAIYNSPYADYLKEKIGEPAFKSMELSFKAFNEKIVSLMQEENALETEYDALIASAQIPFDGKINNLSMMKVYMTSSDREVRKSAWKAVSEYLSSVTDKIDIIYDKMVKNRTQQAKTLGYKDYVELGYYRMNRISYNREMVESFRKQIKEVFVPLVTEIHKKRQARIGVDKLKYYDSSVYFKEGNPKLTVSEKEMIPSAVKMYHSLSKETSDFIDVMNENELFDIFTRKNKQQGGYMTFLPDYRLPFIFGNCNGTFDDVGLITHECGHAFQGYLTAKEEIKEFNDITMETAEIHSMSMEYFTYKYMDMFFGEKAGDYITLHTEDSIIFIPYGCMVDEFQHIVYENPEMTPQQRKDVWKELESQYRPLLDYDNDPFFSCGGYWQRQGHIFTSPFYYIDYVLASICAMQFKVWMKKDFNEAWNNYLKLCKLSAKGFYTDMITSCGLSNPFEKDCITALVKELKKTV